MHEGPGAYKASKDNSEDSPAAVAWLLVGLVTAKAG